jgi:hypothetical protein
MRAIDLPLISIRGHRDRISSPTMTSAGRREDDPERCLRQLAARRQPRKPAGDEFQIVFDRGEVGAGPISLSQCERVFA